MADIFISYKSERRAAAEHLAGVLGAHGYSVWWDYGLVSGRDFARQIEKELSAAKAVVVLWCSLSRESEWVRQEALYAKTREKNRAGIYRENRAAVRLSIRSHHQSRRLGWRSAIACACAAIA
ncbi:MAG: toll/interleukin-1 receptor domain-containing protein [Terricaulis sp.]|nr:toll/interleukin-1 receptor domain-containing protein [Terricaulis sp.]